MGAGDTAVGQLELCLKFRRELFKAPGFAFSLKTNLHQANLCTL